MLDYLAIGHVTKDVAPAAPDGYLFGGTVTFSALTARKLGRRAGILTCAEPTERLNRFLQGVDLHVVPAAETSTFENIYTPTGRTQFLRAHAPAIQVDAVPNAWRTASVVHLGPVDQEVPPEIADVFPSTTMVGATPQGWLRRWDESGLVHTPVPWTSARRVLDRVDALIFSPEDVGNDQELVRQYAEQARLAVVTQYRDGCTVWHAGRQIQFPAFLVEEVDPTGAGDVFATAFFLRYGETQDPEDAARFANCAASFAVEGTGTAALPTLDQVEDRLRHGKLRT